MKRLLEFVLALALSVALAAPAWSQPQKSAPKPESKPASQKTAKASKRNADARHCLAQPSNTAIIKCAEAYL